ncbi:rai1 protein [Aureobasidium subglaciale]|nr:rai1 protein [Aureobasidium subglaciale]KAI5224428.1 rai1 protein [Aureobasidium subglaciale]KAI5260980.1 rai1 protein [Aureobasidium subglaciale]
MQRFLVEPVEQFAGANTRIKKPTELAYFSYDSEHKLKPLDNESLRYYYPPFFSFPGHQDNRFPFELSKGYDTFRQRDDSGDEHLDGLLDTLVEAETRNGKKTEVDIVTWRGMMTRILTAPYELEDGAKADPLIYNSFIEENHAYKTASKEAQKARFSRNRGPPQDMAMYWGYKFETLSLLNKPWGETSREEIEGREDEVVDNYAQYCSICRTEIGGTSMVIGGEVDGVLGYKPDDPQAPARWVELKTSKQPEHERDRWVLDKKLLKFWAQSFLLNVPKIVIGFRSRDGKLLNIEELSTQQIPSRIQREGTYKWNGNTCINFTSQFLAFLKHTIVGEGIWRIRREAKSAAIEVFKVEESGTGKILTQNFIDHRNSMFAGAVPAA